MSAMRAFLRRVRGLLRGRATEDELASELESHLQLHIDDNLRAGMSPAEARRLALIRFGPVEAIKDTYRDRATLPLLEHFFQDVRYGARKLRRQPGFTLLAVLTLACGVGATAAMFGLVDTLLLRPPRHVLQPERIVRIEEIANYASYKEIKPRLQTLDLAVYMRATMSLGAGPDASPLIAECVSDTYFPVLGAQPALGRTFVAGEDAPGHELTAVLAHHLWLRKFGGDKNIVGRRLSIAGQPYTVVGVAPAGFSGVRVDTVDAWILLAANPEACSVRAETLQHKASFFLKTIGRIRDGYSWQQAAAEAAVADTTPETMQFNRPDGTLGTRRVSQPPQLQRLREPLFGQHSFDNRLALYLALGSLLLFLIACSNLASLLAMRAIDRRRETAVRLQLGASRSRVFRQLIVENLLIAGLCTVAALAVAALIGRLLQGFYPQVPIGDTLNAHAAGYLLVFAVVAGLMSGAFPALQAVRADMGRHLYAGRVVHEPSRLRHLLLVGQIALALVLVVASGLFVRSVENYRRGLSYDLDHVTAASVDLTKNNLSPREIRGRYELMLERARQLPGVEAAAFSSNEVVGAGGGMVTAISRRVNDPDGCCHASIAASPGYFATVGLRMVQGRPFTTADATVPVPPVILDQDLATLIFHDENPVGHCVIVGFGGPCREVIGVSESGRKGRVRRTQLDSHFFEPFSEAPDYDGKVANVLFVRRRSSSGSDDAALAAALRAAAPDLPYVRIEPLTELADAETQSWRLGATVLGLFGLLAVALAAVGIYGTLAFSIRQRTPEIAVRLALGADRGDIARMILRHGLWLAGSGCVLGALATLAGSRYVRSLLFDVAPGDTRTLLAGTLIIAAAALAGCCVPTWRATRIDPAAILRSE